MGPAQGLLSRVSEPPNLSLRAGEAAGVEAGKRHDPSLGVSACACTLAANLEEVLARSQAYVELCSVERRTRGESPQDGLWGLGKKGCLAWALGDWCW